MSFLLWLDTSRWNIVNAAIVKSGGVDGIIAKATAGDYATDPRYISTQVDCYQSGVKQASYHWNDPLCPARKQVERFLSVVSPWMGNQEFLAVDMEQWWANWAEWNAWRRGEIPASEVDKLSQNQINDTGQAICELLQTMTGKKIVVYSNGYFVRDQCPQMFDWLPKYYQWWAQYPYNRQVVRTTWEEFAKYYLPPVNEPTFPSGWKIPKEFDLWQISGDKFYLPGIEGAIDLNLVKPEFLGVPAPEPQPTPSQVYLPSAINVRLGPWALDWATTKAGKTVPVIGSQVDSDGKVWLSVPAWIAGWLTKPQ